MQNPPLQIWFSWRRLFLTISLSTSDRQRVSHLRYVLWTTTLADYDQAEKLVLLLVLVLGLKIWSLWRISTHTNLQIRTVHLVILSIGLACFQPLARRCFPKTHGLRPIRFCTLNELNRDWETLLKKTSISLMSTKLIVFRALFTREILIIYVPQVRPPRLPWRKCRDIFVGQHMTRHNKKKATPATTRDVYINTELSFSIPNNWRFSHHRVPYSCAFDKNVVGWNKGRKLNTHCCSLALSSRT